GSDGPARPSHKANAELTFELDHWMGADHMLYMKEIELAANLLHSSNVEELMECMQDRSVSDK
ncbi:MAG: hypothetical protein ACERJ2_19215, partial [Filomicrobium sp.]